MDEGQSSVTHARRIRLPRSRPALLVLGIVLVGVLILARMAVTAAQSGGSVVPAPASTPAGTPAIELPPVVLAAHGLIQPAARAHVGTLAGGNVAELLMDVGDVAETGQTVARVVAASGQAELVLAPWRGTITDVLLRAGDSALPGAKVFTLEDLSRLQLETSDVDEYLVSRLRRGQLATVAVDAVPSRSLRGTIVRVAASPQALAEGSSHYPVVVDLGSADRELRPGMSAHVTFQE